MIPNPADCIPADPPPSRKEDKICRVFLMVVSCRFGNAKLLE